jgi:hypothetical protein
MARSVLFHRASRTSALVGNKLALAGTILYLLEWVAIAFIPDLPTDKLGEGQAAIVDAYSSHAGRTGFAAGWFAFVLLGRVVFVAGARSSLRGSSRALPLADVALAAMTLSVAFEVAATALSAAGAWLAHAHAAPSAIVALDALNSMLLYPVYVVIGVSVLACSVSMLLSGLFRNWLPWLGVVAGVLLVAGGMTAAATAGSGGNLHDATAGGGLGVPVFWIWMISTSVVLFRAAPPRREAALQR